MKIPALLIASMVGFSMNVLAQTAVKDTVPASEQPKDSVKSITTSPAKKTKKKASKPEKNKKPTDDPDFWRSCPNCGLG